MEPSMLQVTERPNFGTGRGWKQCLIMTPLGLVLGHYNVPRNDFVYFMFNDYWWKIPTTHPKVNDLKNDIRLNLVPELIARTYH